nr:MAG TPA: hypothetical protein [Caudoviricetes sp.]
MRTRTGAASVGGSEGVKVVGFIYSHWQHPVPDSFQARHARRCGAAQLSGLCRA